MTQQPYGYPSGTVPTSQIHVPADALRPHPQAPQPYAPPAPYGQAGYPAAPGYAPQPAYGQQPPAPQYPRADASQLNLSAFDAQPSGSGAPGLSFKVLGTGYTMTVERDVRDSDVQQDTQPVAQGGAPKFYRDGRPQLVMVVPVILDAPDAEHPDGRASLYVRSGVRDALAAAGLQGAPKGGDRIMVQLVEQRPGRGTIPKNIYAAQYVPAGGQGQVQTQQVQAPPAPAPVQPMSLGGPQYAQQPPAPTQPPVQVPEQPQAPAPQGFVNPAQAPQVPQPPAQPVQQQAQPVQGLPGLSPEQQALLARIQSGQQ